MSQAKACKERRAKSARRSSRPLCPRPLLRDSTKEISLSQPPKNQNPLRDTLPRGLWALADFFGASPVASALDFRVGRDPNTDHIKPITKCRPAPLKPDLSTLQRTGHFYFALTVGRAFLPVRVRVLGCSFVGARRAVPGRTGILGQ